MSGRDQMVEPEPVPQIVATYHVTHDQGTTWVLAREVFTGIHNFYVENIPGQPIRAMFLADSVDRQEVYEP